MQIAAARGASESRPISEDMRCARTLTRPSERSSKGRAAETQQSKEPISMDTGSSPVASA